MAPPINAAGPDAYRAIRRLYNDRVHAQYMGERLTGQDSAEGVHTARQVMQLVARTGVCRSEGARHETRTTRPYWSRFND